MEKTLKITGMMCGHCEARVKKGAGGRRRCGRGEGQPRERHGGRDTERPGRGRGAEKAVEDQDYKVTAID